MVTDEIKATDSIEYEGTKGVVTNVFDAPIRLMKVKPESKFVSEGKVKMVDIALETGSNLTVYAHYVKKV